MVSVTMSMFVFAFLVVLVRASSLEIQQLVAQIENVQNRLCLRNSTVQVLSGIKENLIFNLQWHDGLNLRELKNIYECYKSEYEEVIESDLGYCSPLSNSTATIVILPHRTLGEECRIQLQLAYNTWQKLVASFDLSNKLIQKVILWQTMIELRSLPKLNMATLQLEDLRMIVNGESPINLADELVRALRIAKRRPRIGAFFQAVDTFAHFIQTRLQHTPKHAPLLAEISTTLLKIISVRTPNFAQCVDATAEAVQKLAILATRELEDTPQSAHVELFMGGFSNLLLISRNLLTQSKTSHVAFTLDTLTHTIEAIFPGKTLVKQALAIEALFFKQNLLKFHHHANFSCLRDLHTFRRTQSRQLITEISAEVRRAAFAVEGEDLLPILQVLAVRMQNIFRMSHEDNLQVLFLHICSTCTEVEFIKSVQKLVIDSYSSPAESKSAMAKLRMALGDMQEMCLTKLLLSDIE